MTHSLRPELPSLTPRIRQLPVDRRGYPVPWFVAFVNGEPDHRIADGRKKVLAIQEKRCWICGDFLGRYLAFVIGPMCAVNRISADPPMHADCAEWSVKACPFLSRPHARRREGGKSDAVEVAGHMIARNPGVSILWITKDLQLVQDGSGGILFGIGAPQTITCYAEGRTATADEIRASFMSGLPLLQRVALDEGPKPLAEFSAHARIAHRLLGLGELQELPALSTEAVA